MVNHYEQMSEVHLNRAESLLDDGKLDGVAFHLSVARMYRNIYRKGLANGALQAAGEFFSTRPYNSPKLRVHNITSGTL
jgi:hypothetical protein